MPHSEGMKQNMPATKGDGTFGSGVGASLLPPLDARFNTLTLPTIAIMSFGEMGMGIAALLSRYSYPVVTCLEGRSQKTQTRALSIGVKDFPFAEMVHTASIFLSIVPPAEAEPLAFRTVQALQSNHIRAKPLIYMDLNAISPRLSRDVAKILKSTETLYIDGAIIGFPPRELDDKTWFRPAITLSGPSLTSTNEMWTEHLISLLNIRHVGDDIGAASGLKMCFGAIYKGQAAIGIQAYTTAKNLGVLPALREHMAEYFPTTAPILESSLIGSQKKAYRWIKEMDEIQETFATEGGWGPDLFSGVSDVFQLVSQKTDLGNTSRSDVVEVTEEISRAVKEVK